MKNNVECCFVNIWCSDIIVGVVMMHLSCVRQTFVNISYESYILYIVEIYVYVWLFCSHSSDCRQNIIYSIIKNDIVKSMIRLLMTYVLISISKIYRHLQLFIANMIWFHKLLLASNKVDYTITTWCLCDKIMKDLRSR